MNICNNREKVDVIIPIYKGQQYIKGIISQLERCQERMDKDASIGLVLVNDDPDDIFYEDYCSENIDVITMETDQNRGIHSARVTGLSFCKGDYIVFLDQDDMISPEYFQSQLSALGDADAVVCRAKENGREIYNRAYPFEKVIDFENMVSVGNTIVSPGQVLMRREAVPDIWKNNILKNNGVDDWFLWICMMQQKCRFVLNESILFEHRIEGNNLSWDSGRMLLSEKEMLEVIKAGSILKDGMLEKLEYVIASEQQRYISILEKYRGMFFLYDKWMSLESRSGSISEYLYDQGIRKVAIYGMGYMGRQLADRLKGTCISLTDAIDRNAGFISADIRIVQLEEYRQETDLIIVTMLDYEEKVIQDVKRRTCTRVITMNRLLDKWEQGDRIKDE